jgi:phenylacetate-CoA ligase
MNPIALAKTAIAHGRMALSVLYGTPIHLPSLNYLVQRYVSAPVHTDGGLRAARTPKAMPLLRGQERSLRRQVQLAVQDTDYYADLFAQHGVDPRAVTAANITDIPVTSKQAIRHCPEAFIRRGFQPTLRTMTTGTTGLGTTSFFTTRESQIFALTTALGLCRGGGISKADVVQISTSARALLGNQTTMDACRHVGALVYQTGIVDPAYSLAQLASENALRHKQASLLVTYPSYLGKLVETGLALGYGPQDFGLEKINIGGEVNSNGLRKRSEALFGPVNWWEGYGITEVWPFRGRYCEAGHLHFDRLRGLMEVVDPATGRAAQPGQAGSLVLTPFLPYREASILLRYDTGDMVRTLTEPCTCSLHYQPAVGPLLGKQRFCVCTRGGWFGPRDVLAILEPNPALRLPVRCGLWAENDGFGLEVLVSEPTSKLHEEIWRQFQSAGLPIEILRLVTTQAQLEWPLPWRGDLCEHTFGLDSEVGQNGRQS